MTIDEAELRPEEDIDPDAEDGDGEPDEVRTDVVEDDPDATDVVIPEED